ncbi:hypothetical protein VKT23_004622 [Stygiomarasmius scandens]|uniref:Uncharacterized protein n=1 Tax=Marasmiellus scandens TaxID=2682957 RepID=A0ABR1K0F3_9AGAR
MNPDDFSDLSSLTEIDELSDLSSLTELSDSSDGHDSEDDGGPTEGQATVPASAFPEKCWRGIGYIYTTILLSVSLVLLLKMLLKIFYGCSPRQVEIHSAPDATASGCLTLAAFKPSDG